MAAMLDAWIAAERKLHNDFISLRSQAVYGREAIERQVLSHVAGGTNRVTLALKSARSVLQHSAVQRAIVGFLADENNQLLALLGNAGAGKSALISSCAVKVQSFLPHLKVFAHFVGAVPGSTDLVRLLRRLWSELAPDQSIPPSEEALIPGTHDVLTLAGKQGGAILFIDALNQLDADSELSQLSWLPSVLPPGIHCVVSVISGTKYDELIKNRSPSAVRIPVGPLDRPACEKLVQAQFPESCNFSKVCLEQLLLKPGAQNPLWLVTACEELKATCSSWSQASIQSAIESYEDDLLKFFEQVLARVDDNGKHTRIVASLCLLECSRHGLLTSELRELLADESSCKYVRLDHKTDIDLRECSMSACADQTYPALKEKWHSSAQKAVQDARPVNRGTDSQEKCEQKDSQQLLGAQEHRELLPVDLWQIIFTSLKPFLRPRSEEASGHLANVGVCPLDFFHRAVSKSVRMRYLSNPEDGGQDEQRYTFWHGLLADFFERCSDAGRRAQELPYHLEKVLDNSRLLRNLVQWDMFSRLVEMNHGLELLRYCPAAGGCGAVCAALREQLELWRAAGDLQDEELARRRCIIAEFMTKAGQCGTAIAVFQDLPQDQQLKPSTRARQLGLFADALLAKDAFEGSLKGHERRSIADMLKSCIQLWHNVDAAECDEACLAQALSNLCFHYETDCTKAKEAGEESIKIFRRLQHPRLAQAEQHMGHVLRNEGLTDEAIQMYKQSVANFEKSGAYRFDTEYACSLSALSLMLLTVSSYRQVLAWQRAAVASCEAITGKDHIEARYYRQILCSLLMRCGDYDGASEVRLGCDVVLSAADKEAMQKAP